MAWAAKKSCPVLGISVDVNHTVSSERGTILELIKYTASTTDIWAAQASIPSHKRMCAIWLQKKHTELFLSASRLS